MGPCGNPNFLRARVIRPDLTWRDVVVLAALVRDNSFVEARWIDETDTQILVELPTAGIDYRMWVPK